MMTTMTTTTAHAQMRENARATLDNLTADKETQQASLNNAHMNIVAYQKALEAIEERRMELLARLDAAQKQALRAEGARDLAIGTPAEAEYQSLHEQAKATMNAIHADIQALAEKRQQQQSGLEAQQSILVEAEHSMSRITERWQAASAIFNEADAKHRGEIAAQMLSLLTDAKAKRDKAKERLAKAEQDIQEAQKQMADALREWPEFATSLLLEHGEFADDADTRFLDEKLHFYLMLEEAAVAGGAHILPLIRREIPIPLAEMARGRYNRRTRREKAMQEAQKRGQIYVDRGVGIDLLSYDTAMKELEKERDARRAEHRQSEARGVVYGGNA